MVAVIGSPRRRRPTWPTITATDEPPPLAVVLGASVVAGAAVALSLPPFGWWALGVVGLGGVALCLRRQPPARRAAAGAAFGLGQFAIGLWWVTEFNGAGYVALLVLSMLFMAAAGAAAPAGRPAGVLVGWPAALTLAEWLRGHVPLGGLPLGGVPLGQAAGPLAPVARLGGALLLTGVTAAAGAGVALLAAAAARRRPARPGAGHGARPGWAAVALVAVVVVAGAGRVAPDGGGTGTTIRVAAVQGGGTRGLHALQTDPATVFQRQVDATAALHPPLDLVLWPEDVVTVDQPIAQTPEGATIAQLAVRLHATVVAGIVENVGSDRFRNAAVAWSPAGTVVARYDKGHRVPFGEYIPARGLVRHLANLDLVPRDAIAGRGPGLLDTPAGPFGTVISYEVFFPDRARAAIRAGGELLLVPTNASSYRTSQVPTQEVAAAQLRAIETGRDTVQAAPTGYSALIDHRGRIRTRSTLGRAEALTGVVTLRRGGTLFVRLGEYPVAALAAVALVLASGLVRRRGHLFPIRSRRASPG
ncbi:MAG TPA: apolipoprotein N-acyltransferase [Acidimicrobiales bacterium]|nr:apolipoprotein N-acyltransferase [Acidimicrobiales bacterium]